MTAPTAPSTPARRPGRVVRILVRLAILAAAMLVALWAVEVTIRELDLFGVRYPAETQRYRGELLDVTWQRPDGSFDLDGTLVRHKRSTTVEFLHSTATTNALGLRSPEIELPKPDGVYRILVLGDSVAFGWGVDDEVTFLRRWEAELNQRDDPRRFEVVNAGHLMYDSVQERAILDELLPVVDPDAVLLVYVVNDIEPSRDIVEVLLQQREPPPLPERDWIDSAVDGLGGWYPHLADALRTIVVRNRNYDSILAEHGGEYRPEEQESGRRGWERSKVALVAMRDACRSRGLPFVLLDHAYPPIRVLQPFCEAEGIPYQSLVFSDEELGMPIYNSRMDPHANALGHEILLGKLRKAMEAEGLPPPGR